jgi:hypothetical protein
MGADVDRLYPLARLVCDGENHATKTAMLRKAFGVMVVGAVLAVAVPAGATTVSKLTKLTNGVSSTAKGKATLNWTSAKGTFGTAWIGAGALAPGDYWYEIQLDNVPSQYGVHDTAIVMCKLHIDLARHTAFCSGHRPTMRPKYWGTKQTVQILRVNAARPSLTGVLHT